MHTRVLHLLPIVHLLILAAQADGTSCFASDVRISLLPGPRSCGPTFQVVVNSTVDTLDCPFTTNQLVPNGGVTGAAVCDPLRSACIPCLSVQTLPNSKGLIYTCQPTNYNGVQTIISGYGYGVLEGTIATADVFNGCIPSSAPTPIPTPTPMGSPIPEPNCHIGFYLAPGCRECGVSFQAIMYATAGAFDSDRLFLVGLIDPKCYLTSAGARVCDMSRRNCVPCAPPIPNSNVGFLFNCTPGNFTGEQVVVTDYKFNGWLSQFGGNTTASGLFTCRPEIRK